MGQSRPHLGLFSFFSNTNFTEKTVGFSGIRIVGLEVWPLDHNLVQITVATPMFDCVNETAIPNLFYLLS